VDDRVAAKGSPAPRMDGSGGPENVAGTQIRGKSLVAKLSFLPNMKDIDNKMEIIR
jgi:hypothetical protein